MQSIPLFKAIAASKSDTLLQNFTSSEQNYDLRTPCRNFSLFLSSWTFPMIRFSLLYIWMTSDLWLYLMHFLENKFRIKNKQLISIFHACSGSRSYIANQLHSTLVFNVLTTGGQQLVTESQKLKTNWN